MSKNSNIPKANREIKAPKVRLVDQNGEMIGVMSISDAIRKASDVSLDLVEISPNAEPPVCKIMDFGKYKYETKKKANDSKKKQKVVSLKEMKFRPNIGIGDFNVKVRNINKFLDDGNKVKVTLQFRGREIAHNEIGLKLFNRIIEATSEHGKVELEPKMEGRQVMMILGPDVNKP